MSTRTVSYAEFDLPPPELAQAVDDGLERHNQEAAPLSDVRPLGAFATDAEGRTIGGAVGRTWGRCCELQQLWVDSDHRMRGIASQLLRRFEARAAGRGCDVFYLTTLSFQAPGFYKKHGYATLGEIGGHPQEIVKYLMIKQPPP